MWTEYKKEIILKDKQGKKDFLKDFYLRNQVKLNRNEHSDGKDLIENKEQKDGGGGVEGNKANGTSLAGEGSGPSSLSREESIPVVWDSDEELPSIYAVKQKEIEDKKVCV